MEIPTSPSIIPLNFTSNIKGWRRFDGYGDDGQWSLTTKGLICGCAMGEAFLIGSDGPNMNAQQSFELSADVMLITSNGNPTSQPLPVTRDGTAISLLFFANISSSTTTPSTTERIVTKQLIPSYAINVYTDHNGGLAYGHFTNMSFVHSLSYPMTILPNTWYSIKLRYTPSSQHSSSSSLSDTFPSTTAGATVTIWYSSNGSPFKQVTSIINRTTNSFLRPMYVYVSLIDYGIYRYHHNITIEWLVWIKYMARECYCSKSCRYSALVLNQ
jgi:hypothetical protein